MPQMFKPECVAEFQWGEITYTSSACLQRNVYAEAFDLVLLNMFDFMIDLQIVSGISVPRIKDSLWRPLTGNWLKCDLLRQKGHSV